MKELKESPKESVKRLTSPSFRPDQGPPPRSPLGVCSSLSHALEALWETAGLRRHCEVARVFSLAWPISSLLSSNPPSSASRLHSCWLPANQPAHPEEGQSAPTKNSLQTAICILLMDPEKQKSIQEISSQCRQVGRLVPNTSLQRDRRE